MNSSSMTEPESQSVTVTDQQGDARTIKEVVEDLHRVLIEIEYAESEENAELAAVSERWAAIIKPRQLRVGELLIEAKAAAGISTKAGWSAWLNANTGTTGQIPSISVPYSYMLMRMAGAKDPEAAFVTEKERARKGMREIRTLRRVRKKADAAAEEADKAKIEEASKAALPLPEPPERPVTHVPRIPTPLTPKSTQEPVHEQVGSPAPEANGVEEPKPDYLATMKRYWLFLTAEEQDEFLKWAEERRYKRRTAYRSEVIEHAPQGDRGELDRAGVAA